MNQGDSAPLKPSLALLQIVRNDSAFQKFIQAVVSSIHFVASHAQL